MVNMRSGVKLRDSKCFTELMLTAGLLDDFVAVMRRSMLRWYGPV